MLTASKIVTAEKIFKKYFNDAIAQTDGNNLLAILGGLFMTINSDGAEEDYRWLGNMPQFSEWYGDVNVEDLAEYAYTIRNKHFIASVGIDQDELADDKWNIILPRIQAQGQRYMPHRGKIFSDLLVNGTTAKAFDGIAFFSDATGARVNDNLLAGTISLGTPTVAQAAADVQTARKAMMGFKDDKGEIIGLVPDTFVIPPNLETVFMQLIGASSDPTTSNAGTVNPYRSYIKNVVVNPLLTDGNDFYALCTGYAVKPLVFQERQEVENELVEQKLNKKLIFKADYRGAGGYALPNLAVKVVSAVA